MTEVKTYYVEEGNTVRKVAQPLPDRQTREKEIQRERERNRRIQEHRRAVQMRRSKMYTLYLSALVVLSCGLLVGYVHLQTDITTRMHHISEMEHQITRIKADNSAAQSRIQTTANLNVVRNAAVNELGMVAAKNEQIVYYNMEDTDYMKQLKDIP